jgi:Pyruvate/2-oxoacid:ferredoxin oxidoreductase gamma subunit
MYLGLYGGMMRGGNTDSTVVVADAPIEAPPVVSHAWSAIAMHDEFWAPLEPKLRRGGFVLVNDATFTREITADVVVRRVAATDVAAELGNPLGGAMVMLGAYAAATEMVAIDSLVAAMAASIPPYRTQHIAANEQAIRTGAELLPRASAPAWKVEAAHA